MSEVTLFGFPRSVYVQMAGIVLTHKEVPYAFHDLETEMNTGSHIALHPFERVPILRHGDFTVYETSAIVGYIDDAFDGNNLTPTDPRKRARSVNRVARPPSAQRLDQVPMGISAGRPFDLISRTIAPSVSRCVTTAHAGL